MTALFTQDELNALSAPFPLNMHTVREGHRNKAKTKIRWFVYVDRPVVKHRLDEIFPCEWETTEPKMYTLGTTISATVGITIRGITRWDGGDDETGEGSKGALTNAFRRTAAYGWDIALYLYEMDYQIWTDSYPDNDWDMQKKRQQEALEKFEQWYNRQFSVMPQKQAPQPQNNAPATPKGKQAAKAQNDAQTGDKHDFIVSSIEVTETKDGKRYYKLTGNDEVEILAFSRDLFRAWGYPDELTGSWEDGVFGMPEMQRVQAKLMEKKDGSGSYWAAIIPEVTF